MGESDDCYFLYAVVTVNDLMANSNDVNLAKIRYVHFSLLRNCRRKEEKETRPRLLVLANFITCLPPEMPRDSFYPVDPRARAKMADIVNKVYSNVELSICRI